VRFPFRDYQKRLDKVRAQLAEKRRLREMLNNELSATEREITRLLRLQARYQEWIR